MDWAGAGRAKEQRSLLEAAEQQEGEEGGGGAGARAEASAAAAAWEPLRKVRERGGGAGGWIMTDPLMCVWA